ASQLTPETVWAERRKWLRGAGLAAAGMGLGALAPAAAASQRPAAESPGGAGLWKVSRNPDYNLDEALTSEHDVSSSNNFYEFGTGKGDPARYGSKLNTHPWTVLVEGEVAKPQVFDLD